MNIKKEKLKELLSQAYDEGRTGYIDLKEEWLNQILDSWIDTPHDLLYDLPYDKYLEIEKQITESLKSQYQRAVLPARSISRTRPEIQSEFQFYDNLGLSQSPLFRHEFQDSNP